VQTIPPTPDLDTGVCGVKRAGVQPYGQRFMLGLVTLGDAVRYGLPVASLGTRPGRYVAPTNASMLAAVKDAEPAGKLKPFKLDPAKMRKSGTAYPGTMIVYTAARTQGLSKADAAKVAQFIEVSSTQGQRPGRGNGMLPGGYVPIAKTGATKPLYRAAMAARAAILAQKGVGTPKAPTTSGGDNAAPPAVSAAPDSGKPGTAPVTAAGATPEVQLAKTAAVSSSVGGSLLPMLLVVVLIAGTGAAGTRVWMRARGLR
jgi:hypothetical protein